MSLDQKQERKVLLEMIDTAKLIELVKEEEIIVITSRYEKANAWKRIADELSCPVNLAKIKWTYTRDHYRGFLKYAASCEKAKKNYKVWRYAPAMEFLKPYLFKNGMNNPTDSSHEEMRNGVPSLGKSNAKEQPTPKVNVDDFSDVMEISDDDEFDESLDAEENQPTSTTSNQNAASSSFCTTEALQLDADDFIFLGYSRTIKKFPKLQQSLTKFKIAELIMKMKTENDNSATNIRRTK